MNVVLVIPAFNEAPNIGPVIEEIRSVEPGLEILVVDDGSQDNTGSVAEDAGAKVLKLPFNLGYGAALQTGISYAVETGYDACILMDADGQHDPRWLAQLIQPVAAGEADLALGSRFLGDVRYRLPLARRTGIRLFSGLASLMIRQRITDPTSGFQAISRDLMKFFAGDNYPPDFPDADTIIRAHFAGYRIKEVPVSVRRRLSGESMHGTLSVIYYVYKMTLSMFIALLQRRSLEKGGRHDADNQSDFGAREPAGVVDDRKASASKASG
jgi:glycosyltransferase involved in cell wall biosynthesis